MTDRGLPVVDGAPACPFVAFADDRDERATSPDHRHRCYAEARPAPRALAHQEAYCLASAFPVCPTFQDWARREAATARSEPGRPAPQPSAPSPAAAAGGPGIAASALGGRPSDGENVSAPSFLASRDRPGGGLAGSPADRFASERAADEGGASPTDRPPTPEPPTRPQGGGAAFTAGGGSAGAGAGSAAGASAGLGAAAGLGSAAGGAHGGSGPSRDAGSWLDEEVERQDASWDRRPSPDQAASRPPSRPRREPNPPPSAAPPRRQSYPTRRTRTGLRSLSPLALAAIGILALALLLFLAPGFLRNNIGSSSPGPSQVAGATGSPSAAASVSASPSPSPTPAATTYVVRAGDTLSQIAQRFNISLDELIAANEENLPDPNNLQIGDELIIPTGDESPAPSGGASASPLP